MAIRKKKTTKREAQLGFEALSIEGGMIAPEWLSKVAQLAAGGQSEAEYGLAAGRSIRDEIASTWRVAQGRWAELERARGLGGDLGRAAEEFVVALLERCFGYASVERVEPVVVGDRSYPIGFSAVGGRVPVVVAAAGAGVDTGFAAFGDGARRRSAFGLVQEYLNADDAALWGIASDGLQLRIARDNASLTRPAWIEADLGRIFAEERYADFAALWLLVHESRFGRAGAPVTDCALETWRSAGREEGTRAREHLRRGVEDALLALGQGFLLHPDNVELRALLQDGALSTKDYFNQLLRLVYRLIFLLTVEERSVLHPDGTDEVAKSLYASGYSLRGLRERSVKRSAHDRFADLWEATKIVFRGVAGGEVRLGLPPLAGIFSRANCPALDGAKLENRGLLLAVFKLSWLRQDAGLSRVNWRDMGPEELGSVYESLLELVPQITHDGRQFTFASGGESKGNARKTTGSYYTPDSLVQVLLDCALEPVVKDAIAKNPANSIEALLALSVVDPACGSGHFLLAAARRLAAHVARLAASGTPSATEYRHALRQVVGRCIFGVDLNPMAVELCKVSLWMEAMEPGLPLTFLNSHIQHGNALLGTTPDLMAKGIPDAAWDPIGGDENKTASALKKRNKRAAEGQRSLETGWSTPSHAEAVAVARAVAELEATGDENPKALALKELQWDEILGSAEYQHQKFVADAWCAAFVWPKVAGELADAAPTNELWRQIRDMQGRTPTLTAATVRELSSQFRFFHWHLQFPQVFGKGGFDVVLGNPPWDSLLFREEEFFAERRPEIAQAPTAAARKKFIAKLAIEDSSLFSAYQAALREVDGINAFVRSGVRYPLCGVGRVNLFALFAEAARALVAKRGRVGQILPSGIVSDDSTKLFFQSVIDQGELVSFFDFENREAIFAAVHRSFKFGILTLAGTPEAVADAQFVFFATRVDHLKDPERRFALSAKDIALLNPTTKTCPIFRSRRDAEITKGIYRRVPVLADSGWDLELRRLLNSADDSGSFLDGPGDDRLPLYQAKYFHQFDHRWATSVDGGDRGMTVMERLDPYCSSRTGFYYPAQDAMNRFGVSWKHSWVVAWRRIARSTDERTLIASVLPSLAIPDTARVMFPSAERVVLVPALLANLDSLVFDYVVRQKVGGTDVSAFIVEQLALLSPRIHELPAGWDPRYGLIDWLHPRVLELTYTAWDLESFARDVGHFGPPFRWDPDRRFLLRCEIDAAFFHLYGLSRNETDYVLDTFPIVRRHDKKAHGEYRTKRVILEIYDALAEAARTGASYETRLDPPPADPRVAHSARVPVEASVRQTPLPEAWARPRSDEPGEAAAALAAVLKAYGAPTDRRQVRLAALLTLEPSLLRAHLDNTERREWARAVGRDASAQADYNAASQAWGAAVRGLRARGRLLEDSGTGTWAPGPNIDIMVTEGWADGRAAFVTKVLRRLATAAELDAIILQLPADARGWVDAAA